MAGVSNLRTSLSRTAPGTGLGPPADPPPVSGAAGVVAGGGTGVLLFRVIAD